MKALIPKDFFSSDVFILSCVVLFILGMVILTIVRYYKNKQVVRTLAPEFFRTQYRDGMVYWVIISLIVASISSLFSENRLFRYLTFLTLVSQMIQLVIHNVQGVKFYEKGVIVSNRPVYWEAFDGYSMAVYHSDGKFFGGEEDCYELKLRIKHGHKLYDQGIFDVTYYIDQEDRSRIDYFVQNKIGVSSENFAYKQ